MNNKKVVIVCTGHFASLGLIRSLGRAGYRPECYIFGYNADSVIRSKYVSMYKICDSAKDAISYLIEYYPVFEDKPVLFTTGDVQQYLVDMNHDVLQKKFIIFSAGTQGRIGWLMDKQHIGELAKKHGLNVPWMVRMHRGDSIPNDISYPVFTKSAKTADGGKPDEHICRTVKELEAAGKSMLSDEWLILPYIEKIKEVNYFGLSVKGKVYMDYLGEDIRPPKGAYGGYNFFHPCPKDHIYQSVVSLIQETGYEGLFEVDFLLDKNGVLHFTEVNFRTDGGIYQLTYGINLPDWWCRLARLGADELPEHLPVSGKSYHGMSEEVDFSNSVLSGKINIFVWIWQFICSKRHTCLYHGDLWPIIYRLFHSFSKRVFGGK